MVAGALGFDGSAAVSVGRDGTAELGGRAFTTSPMRSGLLGAPGTFRSAGASPVVLLSDVMAARSGASFFGGVFARALTRWVAEGFAEARAGLGVEALVRLLRTRGDSADFREDRLDARAPLAGFAAAFGAFLVFFERAERLATFLALATGRRRAAGVRDELDFALDFLGFGMLPAEVLRRATH
jgi:hypothetical protein